LLANAKTEEVAWFSNEGAAAESDGEAQEGCAKEEFVEVNELRAKECCV
jgi:hypothetical protein